MRLEIDPMKNAPINAVRLSNQSSVLKRVVARGNATLRGISGGDRFSNLTRALENQFTQIRAQLGRPPRLLDFGCGNMAIGEALDRASCVRLEACTDIYEPPASSDPQKWSKYRQVKGDVLPFEDNAFDASMANDVLHHAGMERAVLILRELARCSTYIVIKDHFEYGPASRQLLRLADWYGNWAYDVNVPDRYFDTAAWAQTVSAAGLKEVRRTVGVTIHTGLFGLILPSRLHFISILSKSDD